MRVSGNIPPDAISLESYGPLPGHIEARLRENVKDVSAADEMTGAEITMYEYDEYTFVVAGRENLREEIESNFADWIATGRTLEVNEAASAVVDMKNVVQEYEDLQTGMDAAYREGVNSI